MTLKKRDLTFRIHDFTSCEYLELFADGRWINNVKQRKITRRTRGLTV